MNEQVPQHKPSKDLPGGGNNVSTLKTNKTGQVPNNDAKKSEDTGALLRVSIHCAFAASLRASGADVGGSAISSGCGYNESSEGSGDESECELHNEWRVELLRTN